MVGGDDPIYIKFWVEIADFKPIFARSTSAVTPSENNSINTNRKSTTRFPMNLRLSSYVALSSSKRAVKRLVQQHVYRSRVQDIEELFDISHGL